MRRRYPLVLAAGAVFCALAGSAAGQAATYHLFISPMGEPFRAPVGKPYPSETWFARVDANHDGVISRDEFRADAAAWFKVLDLDKDGRITDIEMQIYERQTAPEIVANTTDTSQMGVIKYGPDQSPAHTLLAQVLQGAASYAMINDPEPVKSADADFNLKVTLQEWMAAADRRFKLLDQAGTGALKLGALPHTPSQGATQ